MAEVAVVMTGEEAKLWRAQQKILAQTRELEGSYKKVGSAGKKAGDDGEKAAKNQAAAQQRLATSIGATVAQWVSVTTVVTAAQQAIAHHQQETDAATRSFDALSESRRRLTQVSVDAADRQQLESRADAAAAKYGVERDVARRVMFAARSEGFENYYEQIMASHTVIDPEAAARVAGQIPALFPGTGLTPSQALSGLIVGGQESRLTLEQMSAAMPAAAAGAFAAGSSYEETTGLLSRLGQREKSADTAATRISAIGAKIALDEQLKGKGIVGAVRELQAGSEERRKDFLGESMELNAAFRMINEEMQVIEERTRSIDEAMRVADTVRSPLSQLRFAATDWSTEVGRQTSAQLAAARARIQREIANERVYQSGGARKQAALDLVMADIKTAGGGAVAQAAAEWVGWAVKSVGGSPAAVAGAAGLAAEWAGPGVHSGGLTIRAAEVRQQREAGLLNDLAPKIDRAASHLDTAAANMARQSGSLSNAQRAQAAVPP